MDREAESRVLSETEVLNRAGWLKDVMLLEEAKLRDLKQKARVKWIKDGDENSAFSHGSIKSNISKSRVNGVLKNGVWVEDPGLVKQEFYEHFSDRFTEPLVDRHSFSNNGFSRLSHQSACFFITEFSIDDIKAAIWSCGSDKAPGPDGFYFNFVKRFWDLMAADLLNVFRYYHGGGEISIGCNASFIALIPKVVDPTILADFRPISLIGCLYKIYSKTLAIRLKKVIPEVVGLEQSAFL